MEPELFKNTTIGEARKAKNALYYTFEPNRLPHRAVLENKTIKALSDSDRAVSLLSGLGLRLKNPNLIILPYIKKEALSSSKIEGTKTTLSHVFMKEAEDSPDDEDVDEQEVINYANALMWGLSQVTSGQAELTEEILFHMHHMLLRNVRGEDKDPGRYKSMPNFNGPSYDIMEADFVYTHPDSVPALMMNLVEYFNHNDDYPPLIQAAICHYQFEVIHPYRDGNGRIGRLLIMLYLCQKGVLSQALMYPSVFFEQNRRDYYDSLLKISTEGEVNQWLRFFLQGIKTQAEDAIIRLKKLEDYRDEQRRRVLQQTRSHIALVAFENIFANPYITGRKLEKLANCSPAAANSAIEVLVKLSILQLANDKKRYRIFEASRILEILT